MDETITTTPGTADTAAKNHFSRALDEAKAGAQALADEYRGKFNQKKDEVSGDAKVKSDEARLKANAYAAEAKTKATELAYEAKGKASQGIVALSKVVDDNCALIDEKAGVKYGDYARSASKSMKDAASSLDEKSLDDLGNDAKEFVRTSPGVAIGMALAAGYLIGRVLKKG
jgi:ElaB/YqjD/DUF883 family membrane-anchored ribosome-binding protein